eukprot:jgi/Mesen1/5791/ME000293S04946
MAQRGERWKVLYTKHKNQKRKVYLDGFLDSAVSCNSLGRLKVILRNEEEKSVAEKFLKAGEQLAPGETLEFDNYLVDIDEKVAANQSTTLGVVPPTLVAKQVFKRQRPAFILRHVQKAVTPLAINPTDHPLPLGGLSHPLDNESHSHSDNKIHEHGCPQSLSNLGINNGTMDGSSGEIKDCKVDKQAGSNIPILTSRISALLPKVPSPNSCVPEGAQKRYQAPRLHIRPDNDASEAILDSEKVQQKSTYATGFNLLFPGGGAAHLAGPRQAMIEDSYILFLAYKEALAAAMVEEINLILGELSRQFFTACDLLSKVACQRPSCSHGPGKLSFVKKDGPNNGRPFYTCPSREAGCPLFQWADVNNSVVPIKVKTKLSKQELQVGLQSQRVGFYSDCKIISGAMDFSNYKTKYFKQDRDSFEDYGMGSAGGAAHSTSSEETFMLKLPMLESSSKYSKGDVWIICSNSQFVKQARCDVLLVAAALYHGASTSGILKMRVLEGRLPRVKEQHVYALHGPQISSELAMLENVSQMAIGSTPLLPLLLQPPPVEEQDIEAAGHAVEVALLEACTSNDFKLNMDQKRKDKGTRIVVAAATNVAVDRVLLGLLERGFTDFIRVGSFSKIARDILPYSVQAAAKLEMAQKEAERDLKEREKDASGAELVQIKAQLEDIRAGKLKQRIQKLDTICLLDECSQMPEPLSLLPICLFHCEKLVAVGDPAQLPPVLTGGHRRDEADDAAADSGPQKHGLERGMFVRLAKIGHRTILLRTQYRCHPLAEDRRQLVPGLAPLLFVDTQGAGVEALNSFKSYQNKYEADYICLAVRALLASGVSSGQIGVIVLYRAQADLVQDCLLAGGLLGKEDEAQQPEEGSVAPDKAPGIASVRKKRKTKPPSEEDATSSNLEGATSTEGQKRSNEKQGLQVSTVDAFQGMEKDIILLSCCRTNGLGFVTSPQRLNVALTRARNHLIIVGKAANLQTSTLWKRLLQKARRSFQVPMLFPAELC